MCKATRKDYFDIFPTIAFFAFMLCFFAPFDIYLSNKGYFFFPGNDMLGIAVVFLACTFIVISLLFVLFLLINQQLFKTLYGCFFGGTIALYLQGNWDITDYGAWNGSEIDWTRFRLQFTVFGALFAVLIIGCGILSIYKYGLFIRGTKLISCFILAVLAVTFIVLMISKKGFAKDKEYICTTEEELDLSTNENMIILILDAFDSSAFKEVIEGEDGSWYIDELEDFTYFPDTVTGYSSTDMSLPLIITGKGYKNEVLFGDYLNNAYMNSELMKWLDDNGWEKDIYTDALMPQGEDGFKIYNSKRLERVASDRWELMYYMYTMVAFRYMPQPIKNHFYFYADNIKGNLNMVKGDYTPYNGNDMEFYDKIDTLSADKEQGVFQLIHIEGAHEPFTLTANLELAEETTYEDECIASLKIAYKLLNALKEKKIYDNTVIMIMADHGYSNGRQNPLLLIKGKEEHHPFSFSDAMVSYYDLQGAYIELLNDEKHSSDLFTECSNSDRKRYYCTVPFNTHLNFDTYGGSMGENVWEGHAWDESAIRPTGTVYEEKRKTEIR